MITFIINEVSEKSNQDFMLKLYDTYKDRMFGIVRNLVFEQDYVEDVMQEAVAKLCRHVATIRPLERCKLEAYIVLTVKTTAYSHNERMKRDKQYLVFGDDDIMLGLLKTSERYVEDDMVHAEKIMRLRRILDRLPENEQDIIIRKYYLRQCDFEIAKAHGLKEGSIRMKLTRIRRKFLELMREEGVTYEIT